MTKKTIDQLQKIKRTFQKEISSVKEKKALDSLRIKYTGRKGSLTKILRSVKNIPAKNRAEVGKLANSIHQEISKELEQKKQLYEIDTQIEKENDIDVTIPGKTAGTGTLNIDTQMRWEIEEVFEKMGFEVFEANELDDDYHNFTSLNIPEGHPARDIWDTFWTEDGFIPITHTSSMQNRILKSRELPIRAVVIGKCFRNERTDARHEHTLYQCEGIYVDKGISLSDMLGTLKFFFSEIFDMDVDVLVSPDYFPFVEPGNGMALSCFLCERKGCRVCKGTGWLEILGCGMIHPNVLREGGVDPDVYSGFAWGFGIDRLAMLKYGIDDVRHFHSGDLRFIKQF
jgi:phenylalanyl-tRNA synthetase alpha chain